MVESKTNASKRRCWRFAQPPSGRRSAKFNPLSGAFDPSNISDFPSVTRSSLYSNEHLIQVDPTLPSATSINASNRRKPLAKGERTCGNHRVSTAGSAAIGAAASGAGGAVVGDAGQGSAIGAASSAAATLMYSLLRGLFGSDRPAPGYGDSSTGAFAKEGMSRCGSNVMSV
jgi:hypothetical protein